VHVPRISRKLAQQLHKHSIKRSPVLRRGYVRDLLLQDIDEN